MIQIDHSVIGMCATNTYYAYNPDTMEGFIVDPADSAPTIIAKVERIGFKPVAIIITHGHFDHILALDAVREHFGIKAYIGVAEKPVITDASANLSAPFMGERITAEADIYLEDGETFNIAGYELKAIHTPGHTVGGMCYYIEKESVLFSGDTLFAESVGRSDFPGGSAATLVRSIRDRLFILPGDTRVLPGHMDETTIEHEIDYNPFCQ